MGGRDSRPALRDRGTKALPGYGAVGPKRGFSRTRQFALVLGTRALGAGREPESRQRDHASDCVRGMDRAFRDYFESPADRSTRWRTRRVHSLSARASYDLNPIRGLLLAAGTRAPRAWLWLLAGMAGVGSAGNRAWPWAPCHARPQHPSEYRSPGRGVAHDGAVRRDLRSCPDFAQRAGNASEADSIL